MGICRHCHYWKPKGYNPDTDSGEKLAIATHGRCKRYPPIPTTSAKSIHPQTDWDDSCGEHRDELHEDFGDEAFMPDPESRNDDEVIG